jgi:hypothetical protein
MRKRLVITVSLLMLLGILASTAVAADGTETTDHSSKALWELLGDRVELPGWAREFFRSFSDQLGWFDERASHGPPPWAGSDNDDDLSDDSDQPMSEQSDRRGPPWLRDRHSANSSFWAGQDDDDGSGPPWLKPEFSGWSPPGPPPWAGMDGEDDDDHLELGPPWTR